MKNVFLFIMFVLCCSLWWCSSNTNAQYSEISLREKIGQMLVVGFRGQDIQQSSPLYEALKKNLVGGVILFDKDYSTGKRPRNIESPYQLRKLICAMQGISDDPLFIAIDQEGGKVNRLKYETGFFEMPSANHLGMLDDTDSTYYYNSFNSEMLNDFGINMNFSPVVDINLNKENPVIAKYHRSYSDNSTTVFEHSKSAILANKHNGVISVIKHFPGHGSSGEDSHMGVVDVTRQWNNIELSPYKQLIEAQLCDAIMTAHIVNRNVDSLPATLSPNHILKTLRSDLQFDGVVISDDLQMKAITDNYGFENTLERAINSGIDVLLLGNNLQYEENIINKTINTIEKLVYERRIDKRRIDESYSRIQKLKSTIPRHNCDSVEIFHASKDFLLGKVDQYSDERFTEVGLDYAVRENIFVLKQVYEAFRKMSDSARVDGIDLKIVSGMRNFEEQKYIWERKWSGKRLVDGRNLQKNVPDLEERAGLILAYSSMPGTSRHHWGTDIDINNVEPEYFETEKGNKEYQWLANNALQFGFCQTYTELDFRRPHGYEEEKWHWSYMPVSAQLTENYRVSISYGDIYGFLGAQQAKAAKVIEHYVLGINYKCM